MFPWEERDQIRSQLSDSLIWVIWQELLKKKDGTWRVLASELLVNNTWIANMIRKDNNHLIEWAMETWANDWMVTMEKSLEKLKEQWLI
jgi:twitching motility protein PilT